MILFACVWFGYLLRLGEDADSFKLYRNARRLSGRPGEVRTTAEQEYALRDLAAKYDFAVQWVGDNTFSLSIWGAGRITYNHPIELGSLPPPPEDRVVALVALMGELREVAVPTAPQWHLAVGTMKEASRG